MVDYSPWYDTLRQEYVNAKAALASIASELQSVASGINSVPPMIPSSVNPNDWPTLEAISQLIEKCGEKKKAELKTAWELAVTHGHGVMPLPD